MSENKTSSSIKIRILDTDRNCYRDYHFLENSEDIENRIFFHTMYFGQNTEYHDHEKIQQIFISLCHKFNLLKHHLRRYKQVEDDLVNELSNSENLIDHDGVVLVERPELTSEYEAFLFQVKATLDILVKFLNIIYRDGQSNPIKLQSTFSDGGNGVIKALEKYLSHNKGDEDKLSELIAYLKKVCDDKNDKEELINWLPSIINKRNTVSHYRKHEYFAFQVTHSSGVKSVSKPMFTKTQTMLESFEIAYVNLMVFVEDFIALVFSPYLDNRVEAFTYHKKETIKDAPRWYLRLKGVSPKLIHEDIKNISIIKKICKKNTDRLTSEYCEKMYLHYSSFYK